MENLAKVIILLTLVSCVSAPVRQELNPDVIYKKDMILNIDGHEGEGVLVVPQKEVNEFHVEARGNLDLLTFTTCHREETAESAWNVSERRVWLFKRKIDKKREVKISYKATEIEKSGGCPVFIGGYEKK